MRATPHRFDNAFRALADSSRRAMIDRLCDGPATVSQLGEPLDMTLAAVVKHLSLLEECGFVRSSKHGRVRTVRLTADPFALVESWVAQRKRRLTRQFDALDRLLDKKGHS